MGKTPLVGLTREEMEQLCQTLDEPRFRGRQLAKWVYEKRVRDFGQMTDLPSVFRQKLSQAWQPRSASVAEEQVSSDGTIKALVALADGESVEMVLIPTPERLTLCASTQVGCAAACRFCASGAGGLVRNLTAGEIVEQVILAAETGREALDQRVSNLVLMGMGEPLMNYDSVLKAVRIANSDWGLGLGARHITISTVGLPAEIERLAAEGLQVTLAISLHAADDETRSRLVPLNREVGVERLLEAACRYFEKTGREVTFEIVLIDGINCSKRRALTMAKRLEGIRCNVNVIPLNRTDLAGFAPPPPPDVDEFCSTLRRHGVNVHLRRRRGVDIDAACGQLRRRHQA